MDNDSLDYPVTLAALRRRWWAYVLFCTAFLASSYALLLAAWEPSYALRWLAISSAAMVYPVAVLWRELKHNHRSGESTLLASLGPGNLLSLLRGTLVSGLAGFIFSPWPSGWLAWLPGSLYILSDVTDFLDGYLARKSRQATRLGEILEMSFDGLGVLVGSLLIVQYGQAPIWYLWVAFARYLFLGGIWLRRRLGKPVYDLPPSAMRRAFAAWQMGLVAALLLPVFSPPGTTLAAILFTLPFLAGFLRDWLSVSGSDRQSGELAAGIKTAAESWLPLAVRASLLLLTVAVLPDQFRDLGLQTPVVILIALLEVVALLSVAAGFAGRVAAIVGLVILGIHQNTGILVLLQYLMAVAYTVIIFSGTGPYSLWKPEEYLIYRRIGERQATRNRVGILDETPG